MDYYRISSSICGLLIVVAIAILTLSEINKAHAAEPAKKYLGSVAVTTSSVSYNNVANPQVWVVEAATEIGLQDKIVYDGGRLIIHARDCVVVYNNDRWKQVKLQWWEETKP